MIETHAMLNYRIAVKMAERLATLDIAWYEEPAGPESSQTLRAMRERIPSDVAICVGERHYTRFGIRSLLEKHVCDIISRILLGVESVGDETNGYYAEAYQVLLAPHNPMAFIYSCFIACMCFRSQFLPSGVYVQ